MHTAAQLPLPQLIEQEKKEYEAAVAVGPAMPPGTDVDLGMRVRVRRREDRTEARPHGSHAMRACCCWLLQQRDSAHRRS